MDTAGFAKAVDDINQIPAHTRSLLTKSCPISLICLNGQLGLKGL